MILPKHSLQARKVVSNNINDTQYQPAGFDMSVREVHHLVSEGSIDFDNTGRKLSDTRAIEWPADGWLHLKKGAYKIIYNETVKIPKDCAALAFPRSSLLRCGAYLQCAVWDPGYEGRSESLLIVANENGLRLKKDAKVVQLVFFKLEEEAKEGYSGKYHKENI